MREYEQKWRQLMDLVPAIEQPLPDLTSIIWLLFKIELETAALQALESMTREQWAAVARQAIELDPRGMCGVVDSVAGGLDASPARRLEAMRKLCDTALVNALLANQAPGARGWREREASMVLRAGGDTARLRQELEELPYQRKLQLLDAQMVVGRVDDTHQRDVQNNLGEDLSQKPWVTRMLQAAPDVTSEEFFMRAVHRSLDTRSLAKTDPHTTRIQRAIGRSKGNKSSSATVLVAWDSPVSYRTVLHDSRVTGLLRDSQIDVVTRTTTRAEAGTAQWLPADGNLADIDSVHAFATVRTVVDAVERVLRDIEGIEREEFMQDLEAMDDGRCSDVLAEKDKGLRWQVGKTLLVDTRAKGVEPAYSRGAKGCSSPAFEAVAHTAGYAVLDALRPKWAEGIAETPEGAVLHEMFADLAGLLVGLGTAAVSGAVAAQTRGDMDAESITRRLQAGIADTLGLSGMRSACSTATAKDVWSPQTGKLQEGSKRWGSREVSAMITSSVWAAIASELARRCCRAATDRERMAVAAEDPAEVLSQLARLALRTLIVACLSPQFKDEAPKLVVFCDTLVDPAAAFGVALQRELQRRFLLSAMWSVQSKDQTDCLSLKRASIDHTSASAGRTVECPVSRQLWATLRTGAQQALDVTEDEVGAWKVLVETWGRVEKEAAGQVFADRRMWSAIVVEAAEEQTAEGIRASVRKLVLSLEYATGCCKESPSLALWRRVLSAYSNTN
eukprot:m51a1_g8610 hypothetical protein (732) ;mRNA; r:209089-220641